MEIFGQLESEVRYYLRKFPDVFVSAKGTRLRGRSGRTYLDFFSGAGALNYGHNDDGMKQALVAYLAGDGVVQSLDMATGAKEAFLRTFHDVILAPRGMPHRMAFPGPTGTNAVEMALKLARKATGRPDVVAFENAFHGMSLGALAVSGGLNRHVHGIPPVGGSVFLPFDGTRGTNFDTLDSLEGLVRESSGPDRIPAACIVETVQAEGGIAVASPQWLSRLQNICRASSMLLIVDDIQVGCGRTGPFFSFEHAGIDPDIICLSKSLSGMGLPLSMVLVKPEYDCLAPGEHTGTFRGFAPAFVTATEALRFWRNDMLEHEIGRLAVKLRAALERIAAAHLGAIAQPPSGRGLIQGLTTHSSDTARRIQEAAFRHGLVIETAGRTDDVLKILCPLVIDDDDLNTGLDMLDAAISEVTGTSS